MFLRIGAMELKAEEKKYMISVGYLIPDDEKVENSQVKPEFIYVIQSVEGEELKIVEPDESPLFKQLDATAKIYTKGFIDGIAYYNEVYGKKPANENKSGSGLITEK
jgi:hypothetical protein